MKTILLCGGSGTRLWPLSNDVRSKQYVPLLKGEDGNAESFIQRVWRQLQQSQLAAHTLITTNAAQVDLIERQLVGISQILLEPDRRDTFPAIALSITYLLSRGEVLEDDVVIILPADTFTEVGFYETAKKLAKAVKASSADIGLIGIKPYEAKSEYGYILPSEEAFENELVPVAKFIEKPEKVFAEQLIQEGALWNSGAFVVKVKFILNALLERGLPSTYEHLFNNYAQLNKISFDYAIVQSCESIVAMQYEGEWDDLGNWKAMLPHIFKKQSPFDVIKNSPNSYIVNELHYPIALIDVPNCIVVASPDGLLVTDPNSTEALKTYVQQQFRRPMYEERRWGTYRVLERGAVSNNEEVLVKRLVIDEGKNISYQKHQYRNEVWTILEGEGKLAHNNQITFVQKGDVIQIEAGEYHAIFAIKKLEIVEVQYGSKLTEDDIERMYMKWSDIEFVLNEGETISIR
jgi:mannose-1-phosphate guanylyltransferase